MKYNIPFNEIGQQLIDKHNIVVNKYGVIFDKSSGKYFSIIEMCKECIKLVPNCTNGYRREVYLYIRDMTYDQNCTYNNGLYVRRTMLTKPLRRWVN